MSCTHKGLDLGSTQHASAGGMNVEFSTEFPSYSCPVTARLEVYDLLMVLSPRCGAIETSCVFLTLASTVPRALRDPNSAPLWKERAVSASARGARGVLCRPLLGGRGEAHGRRADSGKAGAGPKTRCENIVFHSNTLENKQSCLHLPSACTVYSRTTILPGFKIFHPVIFMNTLIWLAVSVWGFVYLWSLDFLPWRMVTVDKKPLLPPGLMQAGQGQAAAKGWGSHERRQISLHLFPVPGMGGGRQGRWVSRCPQPGSAWQRPCVQLPGLLRSRFLPPDGPSILGAQTLTWIHFTFSCPVVSGWLN